MVNSECQLRRIESTKEKSGIPFFYQAEEILECDFLSGLIGQDGTNINRS